VLDSEVAEWVWVTGWFLFGYPAVYYMVYRRSAVDYWKQAVDVPARVKATSALWAIAFTAVAVIGAAIVIGLISIIIVPAIVAISALLPSVNKADFARLADLIVFGIPIAAAYLAAGADWGEDNAKKYPKSPNQERKAYERWRKNQRGY